MKNLASLQVKYLVQIPLGFEDIEEGLEPEILSDSTFLENFDKNSDNSLSKIQDKIFNLKNKLIFLMKSIEKEAISRENEKI